MIRGTVLNSLSAIGATKEAKFYADLFAAQDAEKFALIVIDPRCLKNPLLEAFISNLNSSEKGEKMDGSKERV